MLMQLQLWQEIVKKWLSSTFSYKFKWSNGQNALMGFSKKKKKKERKEKKGSSGGEREVKKKGHNW